MELRFEEYEAARQALLDAQAAEPADPETIELADDALRDAEIAVQIELDVAWQENVNTVQAAQQTVADLVREQARIEVECGTAARARNPSYPLLNAEEFDRVRTAAAATDAARQAFVAVQQTFKAGVTGEQLEAAAT